MAFRHNISGDTTIALASPGDNMSRIKSIVITNTHASSSMTVNLYIGGLSIAGVAATYYYLLKGKLIHKGESLLLENEDLYNKTMDSINTIHEKLKNNILYYSIV